MQVVIVAGMLAAGKSIALRVFQDLGYYCVDNLPPKLINTFIGLIENSEPKIEKVAIVLDARGVAFFENVGEILDELKEEKNTTILFIDASDDVLIQRYKANRRRHLLSEDERISVTIQKERETMRSIRERSDFIIDTSELKDNEFKRRLEGLYSTKGPKERFVINVVSFGFKYGILRDADLVFDVRFLPNPYYSKDLQPLTGNDLMVQEYVLQFEQTTEFMDKLKDMLNFLLPYYIKEGKVQLIIGIGCTGGRHRSVTIANKIYEYLDEEKYKVTIDHRDIEKDKYKDYSKTNEYEK